MNVQQSHMAGQSDVSSAANVRYFLGHLKEYHDSVAKLDTYENIRRFVSLKLAGTKRLLDIGNGGVFDYDTSQAQEITAIDIFLGDLSPEIVQRYFPPNAKPKQGSALDLPEPDGTFDTALMVMLLHHLTGANWRESWRNVDRAITEAMRVLRPGGRMLIVESCVPRWFFNGVERSAFSVLSRLTTSIAGHPITFQFPQEMIADCVSKHAPVTVHSIPKGKWIIQFGFKWPCALTPVQIRAFEATKP